MNRIKNLLDKDSSCEKLAKFFLWGNLQTSWVRFSTEGWAHWKAVSLGGIVLDFSV